MNDFMKERLLRRLEPLSDERLYQVLDYIEFLESKYAQHEAAPPNVFQRFAEGVEDTMRAGRISASTVAETMGLMNKAMNVLSGVAAAGKSVASEVLGGTTASGGEKKREDTSGGTAEDRGEQKRRDTSGGTGEG